MPVSFPYSLDVDYYPPPVSQRGPSLSTFLSVYRNTFNDLLHFLAPLEARKFCKDKTFFVSAPNFSKSFFELFQNYTLVSFFAISLLSRSPRSKSGAKIKLFIFQSQTFRGLLYQHTYQQIWINIYITNIYLVDNSYLFLLKRQIIIRLRRI